MNLTVKLVSKVPHNNLTLFEKSFYSFGLFYDWQQKGHNTDWLLPLKKVSQYEGIGSLSKQDKLLIKTTPQSRKNRPHLPQLIETRQLTLQVKGNSIQVLTSMTDYIAYPIGEIVDL